MKKTLLAGALALISFNTLADTSIPNVKSQMKVTANVAAGCDITAENINFGVLSMPLKDTSANSNIVVQCSKNASYSIGVSYSSSYTSSSSGQYTFAVNSVSPSGTEKDYLLFKDGKQISKTWGFYCDENSLKLSKTTYQNTPELQEVFEPSMLVNNGAHLVYQGTSFCKRGNVDTAIFNKVMNIETGGTLKGITSSESIKYYLEIPDSQSIWNIDNKYTTVGTGQDQMIPMKANIKSAANVTHRMTPDTYTSTLTVVLSY